MAAGRTFKTSIDLPTERREKLVVLLNQHLAATTRSSINAATELGDAVSADLPTEVSRGLDKSLWLLEAHLQA